MYQILTSHPLFYFRLTGGYKEEVFFETNLPYYFPIYHMEKDLYVPNSIILTYLHSIQSYDGNTLTNIAGKATEFEYQDGEGEAARFYEVTHFTQLNDTQLLVVDSGNRRLRLIDRVTRATSEFLSSNQYRNDYRMSNDHGAKVFKDFKDSNQVLSIASAYAEILYAIDINYRNVSVFASWTGGYDLDIKCFTQHKDSGNIYVLVQYEDYYHIGYIDYESRLWSLFPSCGSSEGPLGSISNCNFNNHNYPFMFISPDKILLGYSSWDMHSIDVISNTTKELSLTRNWHQIYSALVVGNTLYTGGEHGTVYSYTGKWFSMIAVV